MLQRCLGSKANISNTTKPNSSNTNNQNQTVKFCKLKQSKPNNKKTNSFTAGHTIFTMNRDLSTAGDSGGEFEKKVVFI